jgi:hypothetical protein
MNLKFKNKKKNKLNFGFGFGFWIFSVFWAYHPNPIQKLNFFLGGSNHCSYHIRAVKNKNNLKNQMA